MKPDGDDGVACSRPAASDVNLGPSSKLPGADLYFSAPGTEWMLFLHIGDNAPNSLRSIFQVLVSHCRYLSLTRTNKSFIFSEALATSGKRLSW